MPSEWASERWVCALPPPSLLNAGLRAHKAPSFLPRRLGTQWEPVLVTGSRQPAAGSPARCPSPTAQPLSSCPAFLVMAGLNWTGEGQRAARPLCRDKPSLRASKTLPWTRGAAPLVSSLPSRIRRKHFKFRKATQTPLLLREQERRGRERVLAARGHSSQQHELPHAHCAVNTTLYICSEAAKGPSVSFFQMGILRSWKHSNFIAPLSDQNPGYPHQATASH